MEPLIRVIYADTSVGKLNAEELKIMLAADKISAFLREDGWVQVNLKPIRGKGGTYTGPERRRAAKDPTLRPR